MRMKIGDVVELKSGSPKFTVIGNLGARFEVMSLDTAFHEPYRFIAPPECFKSDETE